MHMDGARAIAIARYAGFWIVLAVAALAAAQLAGDSRWQQELTLGNTALHTGRYAEARKHFEAASRLSGMTSFEAFRGLAWADLRLGNFKAVQDSAAKALKLAAGDHARAEAHNLSGTAWLQSNLESHKPQQLHAAVEEFRQAVWRKFISEQQMGWTQCWDENGIVYHSFGFAAVGDLSLPRYVLLDGDGVILRVFDGYDRPARIAEEVRQTVAAASKIGRQ